MARINRFIVNFIYIIAFIFTLLLLTMYFDWKLAAFLSVFFLIASIICLKFRYDVKIISFSSLFMVCLWLFHCGQIMNYGYDLDGMNYLYFINYGSEKTCYYAFLFYFISQFLITEFIGRKSCKNILHENAKMQQVPRRLPCILFIIGIVPRLYYDITYLNYGLINGYHGTAVYIPQMINTLAFFADIAIIMEMLFLGKNKHAKALFIVTLLYKGLMMMSGSRLEAFCFIIILAYVYFSINKSVQAGRIIVYAIIFYITLAFIMTVGDLRVTAFQSISYFTTALQDNIKGGFLSDMFGEFGSAFTTLVKTIEDTPRPIGYGYGLSYMAGIVSVVPTLVNQIPFLAGKTAYISLFSNVSSFGGSVLGELYYNFGWLGLLATPILGTCVGWTNNLLENLKEIKTVNTNTILSIMLSISLLLLVRGYFSDMVQKIVWGLLAVRVITLAIRKRNMK